MVCHLCGALVGFNEGVMFGVSLRRAGARLAHIDCVAVETLRLIYRREVQGARDLPGQAGEDEPGTRSPGRRLMLLSGSSTVPAVSRGRVMGVTACPEHRRPSPPHRYRPC